MDTEDSTTVTVTFKLTTAEALDVALVLPRLVADLHRFAWRSAGDTPDTVARWGLVLNRLGEELAKAGYPAQRRV